MPHGQSKALAGANQDVAADKGGSAVGGHCEEDGGNASIMSLLTLGFFPYQQKRRK